MCINLEASLVAGTIGMISAIVVMGKGNYVIGLWIATYTLVQFYEACLYAGIDPKISIDALLLAQGIVLIGGLALVKDARLFVALLVVIILYLRRTTSLQLSCSDTCLWTGGNARTLTWAKTMYVLMFASALFVGSLNLVVMVYLTTAILAAVMSRGSPGHMPSLWCFFSALVAPIVAMNI